jgi:hypothetical protein
MTLKLFPACRHRRLCVAPGVARVCRMGRAAGVVRRSHAMGGVGSCKGVKWEGCSDTVHHPLACKIVRRQGPRALGRLIRGMGLQRAAARPRRMRVMADTTAAAVSTCHEAFLVHPWERHVHECEQIICALR